MTMLIVTGNGFDIAHSLPTQFPKFMEFISENSDYDFYSSLIKYIPQDILWSSFEEALSYLDYEQLKEDNSQYLLGYSDENWRDSAHHDYQYMIEKELSFADKIQKYLYNWIQSINTNVHSIFNSQIINNENLFINFNYTDTLEKVYNIKQNRILYIHGSVNQQNTLIVGHHDNSLFKEPMPTFNSEEEQQLFYEQDITDVRIAEADEIIKTYFKKTYKDTTSIIQNNIMFFQQLKNINEIIIYGHSLSKIDIDYFTMIKKIVPMNCKWNISYHSHNDYINASNFIQTMNIINSNIFYF